MGAPKSDGKTTSEDADYCHGMIPSNRALEMVGDHRIQRTQVANYEPLSGVWTSAHEQERNGRNRKVRVNQRLRGNFENIILFF